MVDKLIGRLKGGNEIKQKYLKMIISSQIKLNEDQIRTVNTSKKDLKIYSILDEVKFKPDQEILKNATINPYIVKKTETLEKIKA